MQDFFGQRWAELLARATSPMKIRLILQPVVAIVLAVRAGLRDARVGQSPFLRAISVDPTRRRTVMREAWSDTAKLFIVACLLDLVYQALVLHAFRPVQTLIVAMLLALIPYLLLRGPATRIARARIDRRRREARQG
jgi:hypothetical protein